MPEADVAKIQGILIGWIALVHCCYSWGAVRGHTSLHSESLTVLYWCSRRNPLVRTHPNKIQLKNPRVGGMSL